MNNYDYVNDEWYRYLKNNSYRNMNMDMPSLFTPSEGYDYGNLFSELYNQYKNYKPNILKASDDREKLLLDLSRTCFAAHELNLYLDTHPNDSSMLALFNDYQSRISEMEKKYESMYGPLNVSSEYLSKTPFMWVNSIWPWEGRFNV